MQDRVPLEPEQLAQALNNQVIGRRVERVVGFISTKDGRDRYVVVLENGTALLFAPNGTKIVMTLVQDIKPEPT